MESSSASETVAIVMAAGKSTRMKSDLPKVLHELCGQPLLAYVLAALHDAGIRRKLVVVGFGAEDVIRRFEGVPDLEFVHQTQQRGTGHAVMVCREALAQHRGPVLVLAGDGPMIRPALLDAMRSRFAATGAKAFLATAMVADPTGLGRIVRDSSENFLKIVEQKDAKPDEAVIREINPSFYVFDGPSLFSALQRVTTNNAQGEYYITDVPGILKGDGAKVVAEPIADAIDMFGINDRRHLAEAHVMMQQRIFDRLFAAGVTIVDPRATMIDARVEIGRDSIIEPFTIIRGPAIVGERCRIGPYALVPENTVLASGETFAPNVRPGE